VNARARLWKPYIESLVRGVYDEMQTGDGDGTVRALPLGNLE
jgi:hypothetical protein